MEFLKKVLLLIVGSGAGQIISLALIPILSRMYSPADYGQYSICIAAITIFMVLATLQFEAAIMLPKIDSHAHGIFWMVLSTLAVFVLTYFFIAFVFFEHYWGYLGGLLGVTLVGVAVFSSAANTLLVSYLNRYGKFKWIALNGVIQALAVGSGSVIAGMLGYGYVGLLTAYVAGAVFSCGYLVLCFKRLALPKGMGRKGWRYLFKRYINFPKYVMPQALLSAVSTNFPAFFIGVYFSPKDAGFYFMAQRLISIPFGVLSVAAYRVFFKEVLDAGGVNQRLFRQRVKFNIFLLLPIFICWLLLPPLLVLFLGPDWQGAVIFAQIITPLYYLKFLSNSFSSVLFTKFERQKENLVFGFFICCASVLPFWLLSGFGLLYAVVAVVIVTSLVIIAKLARSFKFLEND